MAYQVFISYRRTGGEALAFLIKERLTQAGYQVFFDIESLSGGRFDTRLLEVIDDCQDVIVVLSPNALDRCSDPNDWLRTEVAHAIQSGKNLIPVMMKGFKWPDELPDDIAALHRYNGVLVTFEFFDGFIDKLRKYLTPPGQTYQEKENGLKHILLWSDCTQGVQGKVVRRLALGEEYYVEELVEPVEILTKNLSAVDTIILIDTDVTKLSNNDNTLALINEALMNYVSGGGRLICTHDLIYRRTRNEGLQSMFGCKTTNFQAAAEVQYIKTEDCRESGLFSSLPDSFILHDDEICWGKTAPDVDVYFETAEGQPLVFSREYGSGLCIWMNPGDFKEYPPNSILKPEREFIALLREAIGLTT
ncbi:MAG: toll/interleukin-1 receptor domain-containing protein [Oscillospiraceae bacterium]|nr:toll/interleukin-1 receptor domain-containing protein [Oscillospiraceae bacterium]